MGFTTTLCAMIYYVKIITSLHLGLTYSYNFIRGFGSKTTIIMLIYNGGFSTCLQSLCPHPSESLFTGSWKPICNMSTVVSKYLRCNYTQYCIVCHVCLSLCKVHFGDVLGHFDMLQGCFCIVGITPRCKWVSML